MECSMRSGVPIDHGPADLQICNSHVPVRPISDNSPGLNSGGGSKNGMAREWFLIRSRWFQRCTKCRARSRAGCPTICMETSCLIFACERVCVPNHIVDVPWHPWDLRPVVHVFMRLVERMEVEHARVAIVLARPNVLGAIRSWVGIIDKDMLRGIPSGHELSMVHARRTGRDIPAKAMIQPAHECDSLVNDTKLLMLHGMSTPLPLSYGGTTHMGPVESTSLEMRRRALNHDVRMQRRQSLLRIAKDGLLDEIIWA